jgi:hypothetical protein
MGLINSQLSPAMQAEITAIIKDALLDGELQKSVISGRVATPSTLIADFVQATGALSATEQIIKSYLLPAGTLTDPSYFKLMVNWLKGGTTDSWTVRTRLGTTGTVADTQVASTAFALGNRQVATAMVLTAASATQLKVLTPNTIQGFEALPTSTGAFPTTVTVPDMSALPLFLTLTIQPSGATDAPGIGAVILETR